MRKPVSVLVYLALGAVGCTSAQFSNGNLGDGGGRDGKAADVPQPHTCSPETPSQSREMAESCSCDRECRTGFCVDGVCCTTACEQPCMACNLPSSPGVCALVPWGVTPNDPSVCVPSTAATCRQDGTCDGQGGCRLFVQGTECKAGTCGGDSVIGILTCDGKGTCSDAQPISKTCPPYTCDPTTHGCASTCTNDSQCSAGHQCVAGSCGKSANGADCTTNDGCSSGFCVDSVCCNVACAGSCVSCGQTGSKGRCQPLPAGQLDPACQASDRTTCGKDGACNGFGSCALYPENTVCGPSSCAGLSEITPRTCDGHGTCRESGLVNCTPFLCANSTCTNICTTDQDCADGYQCSLQTINGVTTPTCGQGQNGHVCAAASQCVSGQCVDGVCCESSCTGGCRSCNLPSSPGRCLNAAIGAADPRSTCKDLGAAACSTNGLCDGNGDCQTYAVGTPCGQASCAAGVHAPAPTCNASGQCVAPRPENCSPYACNGNACYVACTSDNQCIPGNYCLNASCGFKPNGANCSVGTECKSGFCAQGVCCENACAGACMSCNLPAAPGLCMAVADNAPDPQEKCAVTEANTCGTTGTCAKGTCAYFAQGLSCKPAVCASTSSVTPASTCDGAGACATPDNRPCDPFICASAACKEICTTDAECVAPATCVVTNGVGSCGLKPNGGACTAATQCRSGFCTEGLCCDTACADATSGGLCKTCKGTKTAPSGTCSNVDSGGSDPKSRCADTKSDPMKNADCSNAGSCNGNGACRPWPNNTACRPQTCPATGSTLTSEIFCDGKGGCPQPQLSDTSSCAPYMCGPNAACLTAPCGGDADCAGGIACNSTLTPATCGTTQGDGYSCADNTNCLHGHCVGRTCCGSATAGCAISRVCYEANTTNPSNQCQQCTPGTSTTAWSPKGGVCDDGNPCTVNDTCNAGTCAGTQKNCDDQLSCTADTCNAQGNCVNTVTTGCAISSHCYAAGDADPNNPCLQCTPATSTTAWSPKADTVTCDDGIACTTADKCDGAGHCVGASTCTDGLACTLDTCNADGSCTFPLMAGNCLIGGVCYASGIANPANSCQFCYPTQHTDTWSNQANGTGCDSGQAPSCSGDSSSILSSTGKCSTTGSCVQDSTSCNGYLCVGSPTVQCSTSCSDTDCATGYHCEVPVCVANPPL